jgi:two-component system, cell cycle response regulator
MRTPPLRRRTDHDSSDAAPLRALVVDDDEAYRRWVSDVVSRFGFTVTACGDGAEALVALRQSPPFHLLIVDCEMPRMSGLALIAALRATEEWSDLYAMMLTGRENVETKISALRVGFDDFVFKSAGEEEIMAKLTAARRIVSRHNRLDETVRELYGLATRDELTGLFNRRFFFAEAERRLREGTKVNLVFFDLDDFKRINDTLGHLAGDRILRDIGSLFLRRTRHEDLIARYGGDEFVMLVSNLSPEETEVLARRVAEEINSVQWTFGTETFSVGATTGMACSSLLDKPSLPQLISAGDQDLYKNKWIRKNPDLIGAEVDEPTRNAAVVDLVREFESEAAERRRNEKR